MELQLVQDLLFYELSKLSDDWLPEGINLYGLVVGRVAILGLSGDYVDHIEHGLTNGLAYAIGVFTRLALRLRGAGDRTQVACKSDRVRLNHRINH